MPASTAPRSLFSLKLVWGFWGRERKSFILLSVMSLIGSAASVVYPRLIGVIIDTIQNGLTDPAGFRQEQLFTSAMILFGASVVSGIVGNLRPILGMIARARFGWVTRTLVYRSILDHGYSFTNRYPTGDVIERLDQDLMELGWFASGNIFWAMNAVLTLGFALAMMLRMNWQLTIITVLPVTIMLFGWRRLIPVLENAWRKMRERISETNSYLEASYSGIRLVKAYTMEEHSKGRLIAILKERIRWSLKTASMDALIQALYTGISELAALFILASGGLMVINRQLALAGTPTTGFIAALGQLSLGEFVAFQAYVGFLIWPVMGIADLFVQTRRAAVGDERIRELGEFLHEVPPRSDGAQPALPAEVRLDNVSFTYARPAAAAAGDKDAPVKPAAPALQDVTLTVSPGRRIGIAGTVGSGKSSIMRLLLRIADPNAGAALLNGRPFAEYNLNALRRLYGYAPQEASLFSDSIRSNIVLGRDGPDDEHRLKEVIRIAQLEKDLSAMPKGVDEMIGERGLKLSGGQQGRVSIARALFDRPGILLLDDVTASLDAETEQQFIRDVMADMKDATLVIVSHRLSILAACDIVYVFDQGRVVEHGTHCELLARAGTYRKLYERQLEQQAAAG